MTNRQFDFAADQAIRLRDSLSALDGLWLGYPDQGSEMARVLRFWLLKHEAVLSSVVWG